MSLVASTVVGLDAPAPVGFAEKIWRINWGLALVLTAIAGIGVVALYSAAGGRFDPWAARHAVRYGVAFGLMLVVALMHPKVWLALAWPIYIVSLLLLVAVDVVGKTGMGAQRWLMIGPMQIQPSEITKVAVILVLARYYHGLSREQAGRLLFVLPPLLVILAPVALVMVQPDLGTAMMVLLGGGAILFVAGVRLWMFLGAIVAAIGCLPLAWSFMHEYQRKRVLTFLDPDRDPLGAGYHITQSKIAIGSGGLFGKGFLKGTQSSLNFLPEKQTDFIFTTFVEEWGMVGRLHPARAVRPGAGVGLLHRAAQPASFRPPGGARRHRHDVPLRLHQHRHGHGPPAGGRRAAAAGQQRRHRHGLGDVRLRPADRRQRLPRCAIAAEALSGYSAVDFDKG